MKKVLMIIAAAALLTGCGQPTGDVKVQAKSGPLASIQSGIPTYEVGQYYVYADLTTASNALAYINTGSGWLPYVAPNGYRMDKWADEVAIRDTDGKGVIPRIPSTILAFYGVTTNQAAEFFAAFPCTIESVQPDWFPEPVE